MPNGTRRFAFTHFGDPDELIVTLRKNNHLSKKWIIQQEQGASKGESIQPGSNRQNAGLHLQGYIHMLKEITFKKLILLYGFTHVEQAKGTEAHNYAYCTKADTATGKYQMLQEGSSWTRDIARATKRKKMDDLVTDLQQGATEKDLCRKYTKLFLRHSNGIPTAIRHFKPEPPATRSVNVVLLTGSTGTGKSHWARQYAHYHRQRIYPKQIQQAQDTQWFDGYDGQEILLFDDFGRGQIGFRQLLTYLDVYALKVQIKGDSVQAAWSTVIITTNEALEEWYPNDDIAPLKRRIKHIHHCNEPFAVNYVNFRDRLKELAVPKFVDPPDLFPEVKQALADAEIAKQTKYPDPSPNIMQHIDGLRPDGIYEDMEIETLDSDDDDRMLHDEVAKDTLRAYHGAWSMDQSFCI